MKSGTHINKVRIFPVTPRSDNYSQQFNKLIKVAQLSDKVGFAGVLLFTGNDTLLDPWVAAQHILSVTETISPLVAVNPVYMHPFSVAKMVASLTRIYDRRIYLNMVTGTALSDLQNLGDGVSRSDRYARLGEFIHIVRELLTNSRPCRFAGRFYNVDRLLLRPPANQELLPEFLIAGQSDEARRLCQEAGCLRMQMLPGNLVEGLGDASGVNLGILARRDRNEAWAAALSRFPENLENREVLNYSMNNTDSTWKKKLHAEGLSSQGNEKGYWLSPFLNLHADCPYLVGSYDDIAVTLRRIVSNNINTFILDVTGDEEEMVHTCTAINISKVANLTVPH